MENSTPEQLKFTVDESSHDQRIGKFISKNYRNVVKSRVKLHRAFKRNEITVNGKPVEETRVLEKGDIVEIKYDDSIEETNKMQNIPIRVCFEDKYLAIAWKPSGQNFIMYEKAIQFNTAMKDLNGNREKVWCINDIQKAASGLVLVAKTEEVRNLLQQKYQNNEIQVTMRVLCHGLIQQTNMSELFSSESWGKDEDEEPVIPNQVLKSIKIISQTPSNNAQFITRLDLELNTPLSSAKLRKLFFYQSNHPIIGNSKHTRNLKVNDKGLCASLIAISFTHPVLNTLVKVAESEPSKFGVLCDREARFHQLKVEREKGEIKQAGIMDVEERREGQLLAYVLGQKQFCGHVFKVTKDCLIPRASTESLVRAAVDILQSKSTKSSVLDVGTGCGNILISILIQVPLAEGVGIDISDGALNVAKENASKLILDYESRVQFRREDMSTLNGTDMFDVLVCNPPYLDINKVSRKKDHKEIVEQEPSVALFAEDEGYQWYCVLSKLANSIVKEDGTVILECGKGMINKVQKIWADWEKVAVYKDSQGWDRCLVLRRRKRELQ